MSASYVAEPGALEVFREVTFEVSRGATLGIFGPNGTGKTTLLRGVGGLVHIEGTVAYPTPRSGFTPTIACVPQGFAQSFYPWASLETNLLLHLPDPIQQAKRNRQVVRDTHDRLGLKLDLSRRPTECSGGMLQQAALLRAFARQPDILIADEPFSALDFDVASRVREGFRQVLRELGTCALLVLHNIEDLIEVCDSVLAIPSRPYTINPALSTHALARIFGNHRRREDPYTSETSSASPVASPFLTAVQKALGSP